MLLVCFSGTGLLVWEGVGSYAEEDCGNRGSHWEEVCLQFLTGMTCLVFDSCSVYVHSWYFRDVW